MLCAALVPPPPSPAYACLGAAWPCPGAARVWEKRLELGIPSPSSSRRGWAGAVRSQGKVPLGLGWYGSSYRACSSMTMAVAHARSSEHELHAHNQLVCVGLIFWHQYAFQYKSLERGCTSLVVRLPTLTTQWTPNCKAVLAKKGSLLPFLMSQWGSSSWLPYSQGREGHPRTQFG